MSEIRAIDVISQGVSSPCFSARSSRGEALHTSRGQAREPQEAVPGDLSCLLDCLVAVR